MEKSSHYYAILVICRLTGFNKEIAARIAYASQFVDDAKINSITFRELDTDDTLFEDEDNKKSLINIATCHSYFKINTFNYSAMINNTSAFHFIPGCDGDSFVRKMRCKEDSKPINTILEMCLKSIPEQVGILLHVYADTFSHQGFSGLLSKVNDIENVYSDRIIQSFKTRLISFIKRITKGKFDRYFDKLMPAYGHGQALHNPDIPYLDWSYKYDASNSFSGLSYKKVEVKNKKRFNRAFSNIKTYLERYLKDNPDWEDKSSTSDELFSEFFSILGRKTSNEKKIELWQDFIQEKNLYNDQDSAFFYDEEHWLKEVFEDYSKDKYSNRIITDALFVKGYENSSWFRFVKSVKWYKSILYDVLRDNGLMVPR